MKTRRDALAPDWTITGSSNMLDELKVAARWSRERLDGRVTDRQLLDMVTSTPARIAGIDDEVGAIRAGLRADLLVIDGDDDDPYRAVIDAEPADVRLVLIEGVPMYGARPAMASFWESADLEVISLPDEEKALAAPAALVDVPAIAARLATALKAEGTSLAPLAEP